MGASSFFVPLRKSPAFVVGNFPAFKVKSLRVGFETSRRSGRVSAQIPLSLHFFILKCTFDMFFYNYISNRLVNILFDFFLFCILFLVVSFCIICCLYFKRL